MSSTVRINCMKSRWRSFLRSAVRILQCVGVDGMIDG